MDKIEKVTKNFCTKINVKALLVASLPPSPKKIGMAGLQKNVFDNDLGSCSRDPLTGWYRDGFCKTDENDRGIHTVCAEMTGEFLEYTKSQGNDLSTSNRHFPGLEIGDNWCICAARWEEARRAGFAPKVKLSATNKMTLKVSKLKDLQFHRTNTSEANL